MHSRWYNYTWWSSIVLLELVPYQLLLDIIHYQHVSNPIHQGSYHTQNLSIGLSEERLFCCDILLLQMLEATFLGQLEQGWWQPCHNTFCASGHSEHPTSSHCTSPQGLPLLLDLLGMKWSVDCQKLLQLAGVIHFLWTFFKWILCQYQTNEMWCRSPWMHVRKEYACM